MKNAKVSIEHVIKSSHFRYGDALGFQIPLGDGRSLPGKYDPAPLTPTNVAGKRCAVVCPGNGGLVAQLYLNGAKEVVAIEPRVRFHKALQLVLKTFNEVNGQRGIVVFPKWPLGGKATAALGNFDVVLWFEGFDEAENTDLVLDSLNKTLNPGGILTVEVTHGSMGVPSGKIHSWRPTSIAWDEVATRFLGKSKASAGRLDNSKFYTFTKPSAKTADDGEKKAEPEPKSDRPKVEVKRDSKRK